MKKMNKKKVKNTLKVLLLCLIVLIPVQFVINGNGIKTSISSLNKKDYKTDNATKVVLMDIDSTYCDTKCVLDKNDKAVTFLAKTFGISKDVIINNLLDVNNAGPVNELNIGRLTDSAGNMLTYNSFDRGLIEYLNVFANNNPSLVDNTHIGYTGSREYVENLIKYFTKLYPEVDYLTVISIGAAESGYYTASGMLYANNVYGGMGSGGLISYKNIEYGILSYVKYLADYYYSMGLNTVEAIGYKYCPSINESGNKVTSPHWLSLVYRAKSVYAESSNDVTIDLIVD